VRRIVEAVIRDESSVLTVSTLLNGEYGLNDVCLSLPCIVNRKGIKSIVETTLDQDEREALKKSAEILKKTYMSIQQ
jgi:L-lactate dehydrogenase